MVALHTKPGTSKCSVHTHILITLLTDEETEAQNHTLTKASQPGTLGSQTCTFTPHPAPAAEAAS